MSSLLAASLIVAPIISLHFIPTPNWRLVAIVGFTLIFVFGMVFTTEAKRDQVFAATAAFAAVQAVYVGAALQSGKKASEN